jgi:hypothetical protein
VNSRSVRPSRITGKLVGLYGGATPRLLTGIAQTESTYRQFATSTLFGISAMWPVESFDGGSHIGLMQMPTAENPEFAWSWPVNAESAARLFGDKLATAGRLERRIIQANNGLRALSAEERENMALCLYGPGAMAGLDNQYYRAATTPTGPVWVVNTDNNATCVNYANTVRSTVMKRAVTLSLLLFAALAAVAAGGVTLPPMSWTSKPEIVQALKNKDAVRTLLGDLYQEPSLAASVDDYAVVDLDGDGVFELLATVDNSGRAFFNTLAVVSLRNGQLTLQEVPGFDLPKLDKIVQDLAGDGRKLLVVPTLVGPYAGVVPAPVVPVPYTLRDGKLVDVSRELPAYYQNVVLPRLQQQRARELTAPSTASPQHRSEWIDKLDKEERFVRNKILGLQ